VVRLDSLSTRGNVRRVGRNGRAIRIRIAKHLGKQTGKIVALVGTVTNDVRLLKLPEGLKVCALRFTEQARKRILASKGECLTFDQLAQKAPTGKGVLLLRGPRDR